LLQEQVLSGWSQIMHINSLAIAGDYRDFASPAMGRWSMALRGTAGEAAAEASTSSISPLLFTIGQIGDISNEL
jgi:hypothetical protein